jgi:hypothetical protein
VRRRSVPSPEDRPGGIGALAEGAFYVEAGHRLFVATRALRPPPACRRHSTPRAQRGRLTEQLQGRSRSTATRPSTGFRARIASPRPAQRERPLLSSAEDAAIASGVHATGHRRGVPGALSAGTVVALQRSARGSRRARRRRSR